VHVDGRDADFWLDSSNAAKHPNHASFFAQAKLDQPLASGKVRRFGASDELVAGIRALPAPGHTPGHSLFAVESEGKNWSYGVTLSTTWNRNLTLLGSPLAST
jgi:glyoxylase-like metal-dependent hydrolase (beta-lactamase superfamily II)